MGTNTPCVGLGLAGSTCSTSTPPVSLKNTRVLVNLLMESISLMEVEAAGCASITRRTKARSGRNVSFFALPKSLTINVRSPKPAIAVCTMSAPRLRPTRSISQPC